MLPSSIGSFHNGRTSSSSFNSGSGIPEYARRLLKYPQMDLEYAFWQMFYLCVDPARVYRTTSWHKQTKNQWARDDPAFVAILAGFMVVASIAYYVAFRADYNILWLLFWTICVDFIGVGVGIATIEWALANRYLRAQTMMHTVEQRVEWLYAFDVHCNAYFPLFVCLYIVQFFFVPIFIMQGVVYAMLSNALYAVALGYYFYITFLGYDALPCIQKSRSVYFLYPIGVIGLMYILFAVLGWNCTIFVMNFYFGGR